MPPKAVRRSLGGMKRFTLVLRAGGAFTAYAPAFYGIGRAENVYRGSGFSVAPVGNPPSRNRNECVAWHAPCSGRVCLSERGKN